MTRRKVLITGAASGIGKATAERFAQEGYDVCLNDINAAGIAGVRENLADGHHLTVAGSYASAATIEQAGTIIEQHWGKLDALINCAGIFAKTDPILMDINEWRVIFDTMVNGCIQTSKLAANFMKDGGRIVHLSSVHGNRAEYSASSYSMAKAAINQYCRSIAIELASKNILVNAIAPGFVDTAMSVVDGVNELDSQWFKDHYINSHHLPLKRAARPEEIAGVALFLAGKDASYITGQIITVDGGLTITF